MKVHEVKSIETKSILSRLKSKDNYWGIAYNMNLYRGCQHGCIYCDTRSSCSVSYTHLTLPTKRIV